MSCDPFGVTSSVLLEIFHVVLDATGIYFPSNGTIRMQNVRDIANLFVLHGHTLSSVVHLFPQCTRTLLDRHH